MASAIHWPPRHLIISLHARNAERRLARRGVLVLAPLLRLVVFRLRWPSSRPVASGALKTSCRQPAGLIFLYNSVRLPD